MNTHNDFLDNAVNDELEMVCIGDLTTDVCSDMQNDTEKMCLSLQNATCGDCMCFGNKNRKPDDYLKVNIDVDKIHDILDKEKAEKEAKEKSQSE